jgi:hypothetical protein
VKKPLQLCTLASYKAGKEFESSGNNQCGALLGSNVYLIMMKNVPWKASEAVRTVISSVSLMTVVKSDHWQFHCSAVVIYIQCRKLEHF